MQNRENWDQMRKEDVPIADRIEHLEIDSQSLVLQLKDLTEIPKSQAESPILLIIMSNSGIPIYTKIFSQEWKITEELFGGFLSAFNSFSDEIFSEGLDRAQFGKYTILMKALPSIMTCYVFEGQSFLARQKFTKFNEILPVSDRIWDILTKSCRTGQLIHDNTGNGLGKLVSTIFHQEKSQEP